MSLLPLHCTFEIAKFNVEAFLAFGSYSVPNSLRSSPCLPAFPSLSCAVETPHSHVLYTPNPKPPPVPLYRQQQLAAWCTLAQLLGACLVLHQISLLPHEKQLIMYAARPRWETGRLFSSPATYPYLRTLSQLLPVRRRGHGGTCAFEYPIHYTASSRCVVYLHEVLLIKVLKHTFGLRTRSHFEKEASFQLLAT